MPRRIAQRRSPIHGRGVFALTDLRAGEELIRYTGALISEKQALARERKDMLTGHTFLFRMNDHWTIDGEVGGNSSRWINHSCAPNCDTVVYAHPSGDPKRDFVVLETLRPVRAGEELTFNYRIVFDAPYTAALKRAWVCHCGAPNCRRTMLEPK